MAVMAVMAKSALRAACHEKKRICSRSVLDSRPAGVWEEQHQHQHQEQQAANQRAESRARRSEPGWCVVRVVRGAARVSRIAPKSALSGVGLLLVIDAGAGNARAPAAAPCPASSFFFYVPSCCCALHVS
jgi:hypothetical protein